MPILTRKQEQAGIVAAFRELPYSDSPPSPMSTTTVRKTSAKTTAMKNRNNPATNSSAPRSAEPSSQSQLPVATTTTPTGDSLVPRTPASPRQEATSSSLNPTSTGNPTTVHEEPRPRSTSPHNAGNLSDHARNATAAGKGKAPMRNRSLLVPSTSYTPNNYGDPSDDSSSDDVADLSSIRTVTSSFTRNQSLVRAYHQTLRRCYVLQMLRESDLFQYSTTPIANQHVYVDENGMVYHERNPLITQPERPIEDAEVDPLRMMYPEPFSEQDTIRRAFRAGTKSRKENKEPRPDDDGEPPYVAQIREANARHTASMRRGRGGASRGTALHRSAPSRQALLSPSVLSDPPRSEPSQGNHQSGGSGNNGPPGGGGDPPSDDPDNGEPSDAEPHNSEDEHNRVIKKERISSNPSVHGQRPGVFGRTRYSSTDPTFNEEEIFMYDPTPKSQEEVLRAAFRMFEKLIERQLYIPGSSAPNNAQKTVIQNIPKPGYYYGDQDFLVFDEFIRDIVRWLNVANLCGSDVRWSSSRGCYVLTSVDMFRKNTLVSFLRGDARHWYVDAIESGLDDPDTNDPLQGQTTFMQVVSGLYRRFIHESSLTLVTDKYDEVAYTAGKGIKGVFAELTRYAKSMPSPPDVYSFKKRLMLLVPEEMATDMRKIYRITPENSSVNDIIQAALLCERSHKAGLYYSKARDQMKRSKRRRSRSRSRDRKKKENNKRDHQSRRSPSPRRLQVVDNRRYSVRTNSPTRDGHHDSHKQDRPSPRNEQVMDRRDFNKKPQPFYKKKWDGQKDKTYQPKGNNRLFRMVDSNGKESTRLFRIAEASDNDSDHDTTAPPPDHLQSGSSSGSESEDGTECSELIGSQYSSDAADEEYMERVGFMHDATTNKPVERLNFMRSIDESDWNGEFLRTMTRIPQGSIGMRPLRTPRDNRCLAAFISINGVRAFTLFDSGSTADAVSPDFARIAKLKVYQLENPVTFQLGTKGSRSRISYGCDTPYSFASSQGSVSDSGYFDVANIDRYDAVVGTVFMRKHGLELNFSDDSIRMDGKSIPTLDEGEETAEIARRHAKSISRETRDDQNRVPNRQTPIGLSGKARGKQKTDSQSLQVEPSLSTSASITEVRDDEDVKLRKNDLHPYLPVLLGPGDKLNTNDLLNMIDVATTSRDTTPVQGLLNEFKVISPSSEPSGSIDIPI
ncbi:hypothetical protein V5O48_016962 [Marasmius crinis-equi]|uniref:Uncharacterized protein n=1 Tax=Marasmius crinis-equi TaxID=585013 RepID=A0ABR3EQD0_9AGAR